MAVTLAEKIWEKERAKVEKCPSAPNRCEKKLFPSRVGNQGDFDSPRKNTSLIIGDFRDYRANNHNFEIIRPKS